MADAGRAAEQRVDASRRACTVMHERRHAEERAVERVALLASGTCTGCTRSPRRRASSRAGRAAAATRSRPRTTPTSSSRCVVERQVDLERRRRPTRAASSARNSTGWCEVARAAGTTSQQRGAGDDDGADVDAARRAAARFIGQCTRGRGRHPVVAPVFLEHRPEHLVEIFAAAADRAAQHAFLHRAELAQRAVGAAVLQQHARLETMRADRAERERADQTRRFEEDAACRAHDGASVHSHSAASNAGSSWRTCTRPTIVRVAR